MTIWITADTHFGHAAIRRLCERPFASTEEMDEAMIANWNTRVQPNDTVYHLGDFAYKNKRSTYDYRRELNGRIVLIIGNHDPSQWIRAGGNEQELFEGVRELLTLEAPGFGPITLCHYALRVWPGSHRGSGHVYGHSHGKLPSQGKSFDVGVDCNGFKPLSLDEVVAKLKALPPNPDLIKPREEGDLRPWTNADLKQSSWPLCGVCGHPLKNHRCADCENQEVPG